MLLTAVVVFNTCELKIKRVSGCVFYSTHVQFYAGYYTICEYYMLQGNVVHARMPCNLLWYYAPVNAC